MLYWSSRSGNLFKEMTVDSRAHAKKSRTGDERTGQWRKWIVFFGILPSRSALLGRCELEPAVTWTIRASSFSFFLHFSIQPIC